MYPTTLDQDNAKLQSKSLSLFSNECQALIFIRGEKQVCQYFVNLADTMTPLLTLSLEEYEKFLDSSDNIHPEIENYAYDVGNYVVQNEARKAHALKYS